VRWRCGGGMAGLCGGACSARGGTGPGTRELLSPWDGPPAMPGFVVLPVMTMWRARHLSATHCTAPAVAVVSILVLPVSLASLLLLHPCPLSPTALQARQGEIREPAFALPRADVFRLVRQPVRSIITGHRCRGWVCTDGSANGMGRIADQQPRRLTKTGFADQIKAGCSDTDYRIKK